MASSHAVSRSMMITTRLEATLFQDLNADLRVFPQPVEAVPFQSPAPRGKRFRVIHANRPLSLDRRAYSPLPAALRLLLEPARNAEGRSRALHARLGSCLPGSWPAGRFARTLYRRGAAGTHGSDRTGCGGARGRALRQSHHLWTRAFRKTPCHA